MREISGLKLVSRWEVNLRETDAIDEKEAVELASHFLHCSENEIVKERERVNLMCP